PVSDPLMRWRRATGRFERFGVPAGLPAFGSPAMLALDAAGSVWIAYRDGTLARYRDGRFRVVSGRNGCAAARVPGLAPDRARGHAGSRRCAARYDALPAGARPRPPRRSASPA